MKTSPITLLLLVLLGLSGSGCVASEIQACLDQESKGDYVYNQNRACGCSKKVCDENTVCFRGECCNPDRSDCGCQQSCSGASFCYKGFCCDPHDARTAGNPETCGCSTKCESFEKCEQQVDGAFACICQPKLAINNNKCACKDPLKGGKCPLDYRCAELNGQLQCLCNSSSKLNDTEDCGCRGPCPDGASCNLGLCRCKSADQAVCVKIDQLGMPVLRRDKMTGMILTDPLGNSYYEYICQKPELCECDPNHPKEWQNRDSNNCGCRGPCAAGEYCEPTFDASKGITIGRCVCNPLDHLDDPAKCGCSNKPPCAVAKGEICKGGACVCDPRNLSNSLSCGCGAPCDPTPKTDSLGSKGLGTTCQGGVCACSPPLHNFDSSNCACKGACLAEYTCRFGACECDSSKCPTGQSCFGGACRCDSTKCPNPNIQSCAWDADRGRETCQCSPAKCISEGYKKGCRGKYDTCES